MSAQKTKISSKKKVPIKTPKQNFWKWIFLGLFILLALGIGFFLRALQQPTSGNIRVLDGAITTNVADNTTARFEGKYFSFALGTQYVLKSHKENEKTTGTILESVFFSQLEVSAKKIAVTVEDIKGRTMADTGNFMVRKKIQQFTRRKKLPLVR